VELSAQHFDLRIAGFADLASLYYSLSQQMEQYFAALVQIHGPAFQDFEKESWAFKHDRAAMDQRIEKGGQVKTSDIGAPGDSFVAKDGRLTSRSARHGALPVELAEVLAIRTEERQGGRRGRGQGSGREATEPAEGKGETEEARYRGERGRRRGG
jgi:hypothetical protein